MYRPKNKYIDRPSKMDDKGRRYYRDHVIQKRLTGRWDPTHTYQVWLDGKLLVTCIKLQDAVDWITERTTEDDKDA